MASFARTTLLLGTTLLTMTCCNNAGIGVRAFAPTYQLQEAAPIRCRCPYCPSATSSCSVVAALLPLHKQMKHHYLVVRYSDRTNNVNNNDDDDDGQPLFSQRPEEIFAQISEGGSSSTINFDDVTTKWEELQELLEDGNLLISELQTFYDTVTTVGGGDDDQQPQQELDKAGFVALYNMIDDLFVEDDEEEDVGEDTNFTGSAAAPAPSPAPSPPVNKEEELISFLTNDITTGIDDMPCGMDCPDTERDAILDMVEDLVDGNSNRIAMIQAKDMIGTWELLYTSSKAMILNKSLSGLTASGIEEIRFSAVQQIFTGSKFLGFVEFLETWNRGTPESFDVKISGEWMLQEDTRTGGSCTLQIDPENIEYSGGMVSGMTETPPVVQLGGGVSQCADWQSLGPIKLLDIIYATPNLYIARGQFDMKVLFVWRRNIQ